MNPWQEVHWALIENGWEPANSVKFWRAYKGEIKAGQYKVPVRMEIEEHFVVPPKITLLGRPGMLAGPMPHLDSSNELCYLDRNLSTLDPFNPGGMVGACLQKAETLLNDLVAGRKASDAQQELPLLWQPQDIAYSILPVAYSGDAVLLSLQGKTSIMLLAQSDSEARAFLGSWSPDELETKSKWVAHVFCVSDALSPCAAWPIGSAQQLISYLRTASEQVAQKAESCVNLTDGPELAFVINAPNAMVGGVFELPTQYSEKQEFQTRPNKVLLSAFNRESWPLKRLTCVQLSQDFIIQRNLGHMGLAGKKIMLIGCGTVGGFLAEILLKVGAGASGGRLSIVDNDILEPGNVGRHLLGVRFLKQNKAKACKDYLGQPTGPAVVEAIDRDVRELKSKLSFYDLIIDATGNESVSLWLNNWRISQLTASVRFPPILHCWLEGPGASASALLNSWPNTGCYRCLRTPDGASRYKVLKSSADENAGFVMASCAQTTYVRYPVSASSQTAALALQLVLDWSRSAEIRDVFRHVQIDSQFAYASATHNLSPDKGCPACAHLSSPQQATNAA